MNEPNRKPAVWLVGDFALPEMHELDGRWTSSSTVRRFADLAEAANRLVEGVSPPELVVVAQAWPPLAETEHLVAFRRLAPLTRIQRVLGSWCEGEARTAKPWIGAQRAYWHQSINRPPSPSASSGSGPMAIELPVTATEEDRLLDVPPAPPVRHHGLVVVAAQQRETAAALVDACRGYGFAAIGLGDGQRAPIAGATALLWDTLAEPASDPEIVGRHSQLVGGAPIFALLDFPRHHEYRAALEAGVAAVFSKPLHMGDLLGEVTRLAAGANVDGR